MRRASKTLPALLIAVALCACGEQVRNSPAVPSQISAPALAVVNTETDNWVGKWAGPEGTFLEIKGGSSRYQITINNLDGPRAFQGFSSDGRIIFKRDGVNESIHAGTGVQTGMKWLAEKSNCLVVKAGEGYCRN